MRQHLSQHATGQVPHIPCPDSFDRKPLNDLAEGRLDAIAHTAPIAARLGLRVSTRFPERHQQVQPLLSRLLMQLRLPVITIPKTDPSRLDNQLFDRRQIAVVGRGDQQPRDDSGPAYPDVEAEAVEGLFDRMVFAKPGVAAKAFTAWRAGEFADRHGEAVNDAEVGVASRLCQQALPERFFDFPKVGRLANKGGAMDGRQSREEMGEMAAEISKDGTILAQSEEFADQFDRQHLTVRKPK